MSVRLGVAEMCDTAPMSGKTRHGFPLEAWEEAKAQAVLLLQQAARSRRTITYAELCREVESITLHPHSWATMGLLKEICSEADREHGVMLASLVVRADTGLPGGGYFRNAAALGRDVSDRQAFWRSEVERIYEVFSTEG